MRTYSNFLLFEDVLSSLPTDSSLLYQAANIIVNPTVKVVEEDCGTLLGTVLATNFDLEGEVELATGDRLSRTRINQLLGQGQYKTAVRKLHSCRSEGGVCRQCYNATFIKNTAPSVGNQVSIPSFLNYKTDMLAGNGYSNSYELTQDSTEYDDVMLFKEGVLVPSSEYSISGTIITFNDIQQILDIYVVKFFRYTSEPFLGYMARSYSGSVLGIQPLPTLDTVLREGLYPEYISEGYLDAMARELTVYKAIPDSFLDYMETISDKLEKALFILYIYAIFSNVEV